ncbi:MAG: AI-2E family transporter [Aggregatilineales bacterium]
MTPVTSPPWDSRTKRLVAVILLLLSGLLLAQASAVLPLIFFGIVLAFLLHPLVDWLDARVPALLGSVKRPLAIAAAFLIALLILIVVLVVIIPPVLNQLDEFRQMLPELIDEAITRIEGALNAPIALPGGSEIIPMELISNNEGEMVLDTLSVDRLLEGIFSSIGDLTGQAFSMVGEAFSVFLNLVLLLVMTFYLLLDGRRFVERGIELVPQTYQSDARSLTKRLSQIWRAYLRGQFLLSLAVGVLTFVAALALGLPNALILALLAGIFEFVPNIGPLLALIPAALLALVSPSSTLPFLEGGLFVVVVIIVYGAIQNIESYILHPRIMGGSLELHPYAVIVAVIIGASLAGAVGVIFAAPALATLRLILGYIYAKLLDRDPFPERRYVPPNLDDALTIRILSWPVRRLQKRRVQRVSAVDR